MRPARIRDKKMTQILFMSLLIAIITLIIFLIVNKRSGNNNENDVVIPEGKTCEAVRAGENNLKIMNNVENKIVNVRLTGGILGLLFSSPQTKLSNAIKDANAKGWRVRQVIPAVSGNLFLWLLRLILLVITLFLFTTANGFYIVLERDK